MKKQYHVPGFPEEISEAIELPNIAELLLMPTFSVADADTFRKHATEFQKSLLDKVPLQHKHKYVCIISMVQVLTPAVRSVPNHVMHGEDEWHRDGSKHIFDPYDRTHLLLSPCVALTEFNTTPLTLELDEDMTGDELCRFVNEREKELGIVGKKIEPGRIVTFTNHLHRVTQAKMPEFRFFFRVMESDTRVPSPEDRAVNTNTIVSLRDGDPKNAVINVKREDGKITLYYH